MKKWKVLLMAGIMAFAFAGCGTQRTETEKLAQTESAAEVQTEGAQTESQVEEKNNAAADLETKGENGDNAVFAEKIKTAMANKDMEALAGLCAYPLAVNGEVVENQDAFMALNSDDIFTEERCAVIEAVDTSTMEETMAGVIMGDATPNIIFKSVDGRLGITGIN